MTKTVFKWTFPLVALALLLAPFSIHAQDTAPKRVTATGEALIEGDNVPAARNRALEEALRSAVEQGVGVFISSESLVQNYSVIEDKIFSKSQGYVRDYKLLSEKRLGQRYRVSIDATVSLEMIKNDLVAMAILKQQVHYPRLMIVVGTRSGNPNEAAQSARIGMEKYFVEGHFDLVDPAASKKLHENVKLLLDVTKETVVAAKIGLDYHAEVVLTGIVDASPKGKTNTGFEAAGSRLALRVIDPTTARIFASTEAADTAVGADMAEALANSGTKVGRQAAQYAGDQIIKWWNEMKSAGVSYRITLKNVLDYADAIAFEDGVSSIENVTSLSERSFGGGFLECDVIFKGQKSAFARKIYRKLKGTPGFENLNIATSHGNNIIFER